MADNIHTNTNWFRSFARSTSNNNTKQPSPTTSTSSITATPHPNSLTLQIRHDHHQILHGAPNPTQTPTTAEPSPPRNHHRKSAGATLRTVSSFLSLKSTGKSGGNGNAGATCMSPTELEPEVHSGPGPGTSIATGSGSGPGADREQLGVGLVLGLGRESRSGSASAPGSTSELLRAPAPVAMLPLTDLTEVDCYSDDVVVVAAAAAVGGEGGGREVRGGGGEGTWHNPNLMQMAEMLSAAMAGSGAGKALDVAHNSCVLSLIEGFYRLTRKLRETEEQLAELKDLRERELEQFRGMTEEWMETREAYKAEIKRLELRLAKESRDGLASVALARHGSLVDRAGSKRFQDKVKRLSSSQYQDTKAEQSIPGTPFPSQAATSQNTPGTIPKILDSNSDVLVSRILERREMEEWMARQERRREGRVRAGPVLVRSRGAPESHDSLEQTSTAKLSPDPAMTADGSVEMQSLNVPVQTNDVRQPRALPAFTADNELVSSYSSTSTETEPGQSALRSTGKANGQPKMARNQRSESSAAADYQRIGKVKLPRLWTKGGISSLEEPSERAPLDKKQRRRCYSFEKGDDEVLSVTSPTWPPEVFSPPQSPVEEEAAVEEAAVQVEGNRFLSVVPGESDALWAGSNIVSTGMSDVDCVSIKHSTSTNTVKWVGERDKVRRGVTVNTGQGQRTDSA
ncbi:hypothetical protein N657DRAFT_678441 [Parathielavia appendiculata]|uniref:Uncharacterized protein n=1 Tax=Parathielavia appendiculata TaxID=2587402 RepID=A0AAN6Z7X3_9PEZI|nr:hypothetical protein N657DRAFT_678441 [Parathielavia appendiculata]